MEDIVGKRFESNNCGWFTVLRKTNEKRGKDYLYEIEFDEVNGVRFKNSVFKSVVKSGKVKNPYYPLIFGVGYFGEPVEQKNRILYSRWQNMMSRCYNPKNNRFKTYGAHGVTVCNRWHNFANFANDFSLIEGYDENNIENLQLDKDAKIPGNKIYSLENCTLLTLEENVTEMYERLNKWFKAISPENKVYESNNQTEFAQQHNLNRSKITSVLTGNRKHHKNWKFKYIN